MSAVEGKPASEQPELDLWAADVAWERVAIATSTQLYYRRLCRIKVVKVHFSLLIKTLLILASL